MGRLGITKRFVFMAIAAGMGLVCGFGAQSQEAREKPNILLFMADDMTWHDLGCYGNKDVRTPHLDRLANEGDRYTHCFNSAPMCAPTRMSLYTGIHPVRNGAHPNHSKVHDNIKSLPHYLGALGYRTALLGKRHEAPLANFPFEFLGGRHHDNGKGVDLELDKVGKFIADAREQPWCLVVTSNQPHTPWNRGDASVYAADKLTLPKYLVDTPETREAMTKYYAEISYMDAQFGECMKQLEASGRAKNTLVIFLSEQGSNFPHCKWTCYDSGLRSAAILRWPAKRFGFDESRVKVIGEPMIQYVDILPTLVDFGGGNSADFDFDGRSILKMQYYHGKLIRPREFVYGVQTSKGIGAGPDAYGIRTIRDKRFRLIWNLNWEGEFQNSVVKRFEPYQSWKRLADGGDDFAKEQWSRYRKRPQYELYDLDADPFEMGNLADNSRYRARFRRLKKELAAWMKQQGDKGAQTEAEALERKAKSRSK